MLKKHATGDRRTQRLCSPSSSRPLARSPGPRRERIEELPAHALAHPRVLSVAGDNEQGGSRAAGQQRPLVAIWLGHSAQKTALPRGRFILVIPIAHGERE
jgi:hypothetical protein